MRLSFISLILSSLILSSCSNSSPTPSSSSSNASTIDPDTIYIASTKMVAYDVLLHVTEPIRNDISSYHSHDVSSVKLSRELKDAIPKLDAAISKLNTIHPTQSYTTTHSDLIDGYKRLEQSYQTVASDFDSNMMNIDTDLASLIEIDTSTHNTLSSYEPNK